MSDLERSFTQKEKYKITKDWLELFPSLKKYRAMSLANKVGPLLVGIHLEIIRGRLFRPTYAVHNSCAGHPSISLSLTRGYRCIKPDTYEKEYQKAAGSMIDQGFAIPLEGDLEINEIIAIYEKFFSEEVVVHTLAERIDLPLIYGQTGQKDKIGYTLKLVYNDIDRPNGIDRRESYTYDAAGNLLSETLEGREGEVIRREYGDDLKDRKIQEKNPQGGIARYLYDRNDLLIKEISTYGYGMGGGKEPGLIYRYDSRGNQIQEINSLGEVVKEKRYNAANQLAAEIDGMGNETEFTYLPDGQTRSVSRENGGQKRQLQNYKYNARGQIIGITDGIGETVNYDVDGWGRIT